MEKYYIAVIDVGGKLKLVPFSQEFTKDDEKFDDWAIIEISKSCFDELAETQALRVIL